MKSVIAVIFLFFGLNFTVAQTIIPEKCKNHEHLKCEEEFMFCINLKNDKLEYREAFELVQSGLNIFPYHYQLRLQKALILQHLSNTPAAESELIGLISLYPNRQELHNYLGRILYEEDKSKSLLALLTSIAINPKNELSRENLIFVKRLLDGKRMKPSHPHHSPLNSFRKNDFEIINQTLDLVIRNKKLTETELIFRLDIFFKALEEYPHRQEGFFWEFYVPKFIKIYQEKETKDFIKYLFGNQTTMQDAMFKKEFFEK